MYDLVRNLVKRELEKIWDESRLILVAILHCLYEAEDPSLCVFVADLLDHTLNLAYTSLSPLDCLSVGYFLSVVSTTVSGEFRVDLNGCSIGDQGCRFLVRGLCKCLNTLFKITSPLNVELVNNDIHEEGISHIAQLLKNTSVVCKLNLFINPIGEGGLRSLCEALSSNTTIQHLDLGGCSLTLSEENGLPLCQLLSTNTSLTYLQLSGNTVTDCRHIAAGLSNNKTLRELKLSSCDVTDKSVEDLSAGLNNYIEHLDFSVNNSITENGLRILARRLTTLSGMRLLVIPKHQKFSINTVFSEVNKERRRNGLPEIEVDGECD